MKTVSIPYPEGLPQTLKLSDSEVAEELRFLAAAKLYELGNIASWMVFANLFEGLYI